LKTLRKMGTSGPGRNPLISDWNIRRERRESS
jgi:hypothetical protein